MNDPLKVLIAGDDHDSADTMALLLQLHGYDAIGVYDGRQSVVAARTFHPEVAILDINMPHMNGYDTAVALRTAHAEATYLVLVAHTAQTHTVEVRRAQQVGIDFHVEKPIAGDKLCAFIETIRPRRSVNH